MGKRGELARAQREASRRRLRDAATELFGERGYIAPSIDEIAQEAGVRDLGQLKIEEAIRILTGRAANHFNILDRGLLKGGMQADIAVFDLDEIEPA